MPKHVNGRALCVAPVGLGGDERGAPAGVGRERGREVPGRAA